MSDPGADPHLALVLRVTGKVQGVGYRYFVLRRAGELDLVGAVRNLPDGSVEVKAGGPRSQLEKLRRHLLRGPASSQVTSVTATRLDPAPDWQKFEITYL